MSMPERYAGGPGPTATHLGVLDASPNAIIAVDHSGLIIYANPQVEVTFGYARDELLGEPVELLLPEGLGKRHRVHRDTFLAHPVARPMGIGLDLSGRRRDGSEFPVEISLSVVEGAKGVEIFAQVVDITARQAAASQLLQAQKLESIGRLAGGIAHDFSNMMFAIRGFGEMLADDLAPDHEATFDREVALRSVNLITEAAERASAMTLQLLTFSRRQVVAPRVIDLNRSIENIEPMLRRWIEENVRLTLSLDPAIGTVRADPGQIDQILVNLVVNARDAMPEGGVVTIATHHVVFDENDMTGHSGRRPDRTSSWP